MHNSSVRPTDVLERIISTYGNMLFRYALIMLSSAEDAEDVIQDTLLLRFRMRHPAVDLESIMVIL